MKQLLFIILFFLISMTAFGQQYSSEPGQRLVGLKGGKYPLTLEGMQRAINSLDSGIVYIAYPGLTDTAGLGTIPEGVKLDGWLNGERMVSDGIYPPVLKIGDDNTYVETDIVNSKISLNADTVSINGNKTDVGIKTYKAILRQNGTNQPTATVLENTTGYSITWIRGGTGQYFTMGIPNFYYCGIRTFSSAYPLTYQDGLYNVFVEIKFYGPTPTDNSVTFITSHGDIHMETYNYIE